MAQKTAVDWLMSEMLKPDMYKIWPTLLERAKQMEKEQIQKAFSDGQETPINHPTLPHYSREEYYKETYVK